MALQALQARRQAFSSERILALVGLGIAVSLLGDSTLYIVLPTQYSQAGILATHVGLMLSANRAIRIFINSPYGFIIERLPRRRMLVPSLFVGAIAVFLYTVTGFWPMLIGRLLWGVAWAGLTLGGTTVILDIAADDNRGQLVGRLQMWFFIGVGVSSLLGGMLFDAIGYRPTFILCALVMLAGALLWLIFLPETRHYKPKSNPKPDTTAAVPAEKRKSADSSLLPLATAIAVNGLNWLILIGVAMPLLPVILQDRFGVEVVFAIITIPLLSFTGALSAFNTVVSMVSAPFSGWLTDRSGNRWLLVVFALTLGIVALSMLAVGDGIAVVLATMLNAVAGGILVTQVTALVGDYSRPGSGHEKLQGRILGIMNTVGDVGGAAGPLAAFALLPFIGLEGVLGLSAIVMALVLPLALWVTVRESR